MTDRKVGASEEEVYVLLHNLSPALNFDDLTM
jgi:hypothetical protein